MAEKWTAEQLKVIEDRGQNLLVSAAAGSGKTAVLVERILRELLDRDRPVDLDTLLVVTFTRAATAQLRQRIFEAVKGRLEENPDDPAARKQMALIHSDHIHTIDQFCLSVVRDHFGEIDLDPSFRVADEGEMKLLQTEVLGEVLEEAYEKGDPAFLDFSKSYAPGRSDEALEALILDFFSYSDSAPYPREWRHDALKVYEGDLDRGPIMEELLLSASGSVQDLLSANQEARRIAALPGGPAKYLERLEEDGAFFEKLNHCRTYGDFVRAFSSCAFGALPAYRAKKEKEALNPELQDAVKNLRNAAKDAVSDLKKRFFSQSVDAVAETVRRCGDSLKVLVELADRFEEKFREAKEERNVLDFSDISHLALKVLIRRDGEKMIPTEAAREYQNYFTEVFMDEYQDSNRIQELLLWSVSRESTGVHNRFMVGDVKQSIYRFRMSDPHIFMEKYRTYPLTENESGNLRVDLGKNFRSREEVLSAVNLIFCQICREEIGGIDYGEAEALYPGAVYPACPEEAGDHPFEPELILTEKEKEPGEEGGKGSESSRRAAEASDPEKEPGTATGPDPGAEEAFDPDSEEDEGAERADQGNLEAEALAARIAAMAGHELIYDGERKAYRKVRLSDIVILLRSSKGLSEAFSRALTARGIPSYSGSRTGYFQTAEVRTILAYLRVLDNPRQDIPLASSLLSPFGGLTAADLALIRAESRDTDLYTALESFLARHGEEDAGPGRDLAERIQRFQKLTCQLRDLVPDLPIHQLLWRVYDETGYDTLMLSSPGGQQKKANLDSLVEKAIAFEKTAYRGLFHFVQYIEKLKMAELDFGEAEKTGEEQAVRIMTIHASKGLEFPVVFVAGLGKRHNLSDLKRSIVMDERLGVGLDYVDPVVGLKAPCLIRNVISDVIYRENLGEELRVLYVAMTRAKEKLILSGTVDSLEGAVKKAGAALMSPDLKLPFSYLFRAAAPIEWVLGALIRHRSGQDFFEKISAGMENLSSEAFDLPGSFRIYSGESLLQETEKQEEALEELRKESETLDPETVYDPGVREILRETVKSSYPWPSHREMPGKLSVSELKAVAYEAEMERQALLEEAVPLSEAVPGSMPAIQKEKTSEEGREASKELLKKHGKDTEIIPEFLLEDGRKGAVTGAMAGTLYHAVLADIDLTLEISSSMVSDWLETMVECDKIRKEEAEIIRPERIFRFLQSNLCRRMARAAEKGLLWREQPFVTGRKADELNPAWDGEETVLIQGIIDAYFIEDGEIVLVDYKTDSVREGEEASLVRRYHTQFSLYRHALRELTGRNVKEAWLYSLSLGKSVPVPESIA